MNNSIGITDWSETETIRPSPSILFPSSVVSRMGPKVRHLHCEPNYREQPPLPLKALVRVRREGANQVRPRGAIS